MTKICEYIKCKKEFEDKSDNQVGRFCSNSCRSKYHYRKNKLKRNIQTKIWVKNNKNLKNKINLKYYQNNFLQVKARQLVREDKLKNPHLYPNECCICGSNKNIEYHHPNYDFPYSVYPLCKSHHQELHNNLNQQKGVN